MLRGDRAPELLHRRKQMRTDAFTAILKITHRYPIGLKDIQMQVAVADVIVSLLPRDAVTGNASSAMTDSTS